MSFDKKFSAAFDSGLADIKFCVKNNDKLSVDQLKNDAMAFRDAIANKKVKQVDGVD